MVDLAVGAAETLPEWSPSAAIPAAAGLMCFAKPAGKFAWPVPGTGQSIGMPVDAMSWAVRGDTVGVTVIFRWERLDQQRAARLPRQPLVQHAVGVWDLDAPVQPRLADGRVAPLAVLGAAWLLVGQIRVAVTRTIGGDGDGAGASGDPGPPVSLIELRRAARDHSGEEGAGANGRRSNRQWWVDGHWRQQAFGPKRALRKPIWIEPHIKGDPEGQLSERVKVWRR